MTRFNLASASFKQTAVFSAGLSVMMFAVVAADVCLLPGRGWTADEICALLFGTFNSGAFLLMFGVVMRQFSATFQKAYGRNRRQAFWGLASPDAEEQMRGLESVAALWDTVPIEDVERLAAAGAGIAEEVRASAKGFKPKATALRSRWFWPVIGPAIVLTWMGVWVTLPVFVPDAGGPREVLFFASASLVTVSLPAGAVLCLSEGQMVSINRHRERVLIWKLNGEDPGERVKAAEALALWGAKEALTQLEEFTYDDVPEVADAARRAGIVLRTALPDVVWPRETASGETVEIRSTEP